MYKNILSHLTRYYTLTAFSLFLATYLVAHPNSAQAATHPIDAYNVTWTSPSKNASESMPCGGGDTGLNIWVEDGQILFYMQKSGSLAEQNEYLKLGRIRLALSPNPFDQNATFFEQTLKLKQGHVQIRGISEDENGNAIEATVRIWCEIKRPIIHVDIEANQNIQAKASYENWRFKDEWIPKDNRRRSFFSLDAYPGDVKLSRDIIKHTKHGVLFYHRNPASGTHTDLVINQQGMQAYREQITDDLSNRTFGGIMLGEGFTPDGISDGQYQTLPYKAWHLTSKEARKKHHLRIVSHIDQTNQIDTWQNDLIQIADESAQDRQKAFEQTLTWWANFWDRSWIAINPKNPSQNNQAWRVGRNYNLFRYQLGCNAFGEYPSKFNGGNFTYDANLVGGRGKDYGPDWRDWGGGIFTAQNQRLLYWPLLKSGDIDVILPQFDLYRKGLPGAKARVQAYFEHAGAVYSEYTSVPGLMSGNGYGWDSGRRKRGTEIPFGDPRANANRGYNDYVEKGVMANAYISYHWESQLEHAYMILEYHRFTGEDISRYIPFIENAVIFFDEHYRKRQKIRSGQELDDQNKLVIYPSTACETYRGAKDPVDVISGLQACLKHILNLDHNTLQLRNKSYYQSFLDTVPDYTFGEINGQKVIQPAASYESVKNYEAPQFYPLFPFNQFDLHGPDKQFMQTFRNTWKLDQTISKNMVQSWHQDGIFFARMGLTQDAQDFNTKKLDDSGRRFPTFWGPGHDWVPDHNWGGSGMIGLQEMLMQTVNNEIRLLPAWPKQWDVDFKLHAPGQTTVQGQVRNGKIIQLIVHPEHRRKDVIISE